MRTPYDQLAKQILERALSNIGRVETDAEVTAADVQHVDVAYVPDIAREAERRALGLLGEMTGERCLFEAFHDPPSLGELLDCVRKQLTMHRALAVKARRDQRPPPKEPPLLWVISAGRPEGAIDGLGLVELAGWPRGFYCAASGFRVRMVVTSELEEIRETLILRLLARGRVLRAAIAELTALPEDAWEREVAIFPLIDLQLTAPRDRALQSLEEQELHMVSRAEVYNYWKSRLIEMGRSEGKAQGEAVGRSEGLATALVTILAARGLHVSAEQRERIFAIADSAVLQRSVERAVTATSVDEVLPPLS